MRVICAGTWHACLGTAALLMLAGCSRSPARSLEWDAFVAKYIDTYFAAHPEAGVSAGRHEFDGKLSDFSRAATERETARLRAERERAAAFPESVLDERSRFERNYLLAAIDGELFWRATARWPFRNPTFYSSAVSPSVYLTRPYAPLDRRMRAFIAYERALPAALQQIRENLATPLPRTYADIGRLTFGGLAAYFESDVPGVFSAVKDAGLQSDFSKANASAVKALKALDAWFQSQLSTANENFALGADLFGRMLEATERVRIPLEQLEAAGRGDLKRNLDALRRACDSYAPGTDLAACVARNEADKPRGAVLDAARSGLTELKAFVLAKNLVGIPGREDAAVAEAPPYQRWNFAYIEIPGPYEKGLPSTYYISPPDPKWTEAERRAYIPGKSALLFTSAHEVWPGHFLQFLHSNRSPSKFGQVFTGYAFVEGWAHYAEEMMWEAGLGADDPGVHIGQITQALLRDVRFLSAIGMHTRGMPVAESERLFRAQAFSDPGNARQQAARGTFDPAYLNYTLGKLMIRKLRDDWTATRGGRAAWREFHDRLLQFGGPPIPLVRAAMLGPEAGPPL